MIQIENRKFEIFPLVIFTVYYFPLLFKIGIFIRIFLWLIRLYAFGFPTTSFDTNFILLLINDEDAKIIQKATRLA